MLHRLQGKRNCNVLGPMNFMVKSYGNCFNLISIFPLTVTFWSITFPVMHFVITIFP